MKLWLNTAQLMLIICLKLICHRKLWSRHQEVKQNFLLLKSKHLLRWFTLTWSDKNRMILSLKYLPWEESQEPTSLFVIISFTLFCFFFQTDFLSIFYTTLYDILGCSLHLTTKITLFKHAWVIAIILSSKLIEILLCTSLLTKETSIKWLEYHQKNHVFIFSF